MELMIQGGPVMWPLAGISVAALALLIERFLLYFSCSFPVRKFDRLLRDAVRSGNIKPLADSMGKVFVLKNFAALLNDAQHPHLEAALSLEGESVIRRLEQRLSLLGVLARVAPLLGLLGTITGMINTFAKVASAKSGVDMAMLAEGIWQALITTATGLVIAIPIVLALSLLQSRARRVRTVLTDAGNVALLLAKAGPHA